ncbi:T-complex protein 1 subunit gamma, partial [Podochytrium sp. JEL0797]
MESPSPPPKERPTSDSSLLSPLPPGGIAEYICAYQSKTKPSFAIQGRLRLSSTAICFYANILGILKEEIGIPLPDICGLQKAHTALIFPTAIKIRTMSDSFYFTTFLQRDLCYDQLCFLVQKANKQTLTSANPTITPAGSMPRAQGRRLALDPNMYSTSAFTLSEHRRGSSLSLSGVADPLQEQFENLPRVPSTLARSSTSAEDIPESYLHERQFLRERQDENLHRTPTVATIAEATPPSPPSADSDEMTPRTNSRKLLKFNTTIEELAPQPHEINTKGVESFDGFTQAGGLLNGGAPMSSFKEGAMSLGRKMSLAFKRNPSTSTKVIRNSTSMGSLAGSSSTESLLSPQLGGTSMHSETSGAYKRPVFWNLNGDQIDLNKLRRKGDLKRMQEQHSQEELQLQHQLSLERRASAASSRRDPSDLAGSLSRRGRSHGDEEDEPLSLQHQNPTFPSPLASPSTVLAKTPTQQPNSLAGANSVFGTGFVTPPDELGSPEASRVALRSYTVPSKYPKKSSSFRQNSYSSNIQGADGHSAKTGSRLRRRSRSPGRHAAYIEAAKELERQQQAEKAAAEEQNTGGWYDFVGGENGVKFGINMGVAVVLVVFCFALLGSSLALLMRVNSVLAQLENTNMERETGRKAQMSNINAAKTIADIIRTCLGPRAMLKMLLDPMG